MLESPGRKPGDKIEIYETKTVLVWTLVLMSDGKVDKVKEGK